VKREPEKEEIMLARMLIILLALLVLVAGQAVAGEETAAQKAPVGQIVSEKQKMSDKEKCSYSCGYEVGKDLYGQFEDLDSNLTAKGLTDALTGKQAAMSDQEVPATLAKYTAESRKEVAKKSKKEEDLTDHPLSVNIR
jgi:hypothetical protein